MKSNWFIIILMCIIAIVIIEKSISYQQQKRETEEAINAFIASEPVDTAWRGSHRSQIPYETDTGKLIWYGYQLIANTSYYFGPKGIVAQTTNGMNCQNCHLDGGTVPYGFNFGKVYSSYPQYRARSNRIQSIYGRVNDCFERSLNGQAIDSNGKEMKAIYSYIKWLGKDISKGYISGGTGVKPLAFLKTAADPIIGKKVYLTNCQLCHGANGGGQLNQDETGYTYPPLWGANSYNDGAGLYRIIFLASFIKSNMPSGTDYHKPMLTDEEAWNVAAFVNSQPRPHMDKKDDWKNFSKKPIDIPFGPYSDSFTEAQHKFGPFKPIANSKK